MMIYLRYIVMLICITLPIIFAFKTGIDSVKSKLWVYSTFLIMTLALVLTISPPIAGSFSDAERFADIDKFKNVDVYLNTSELNIKELKDGWILELDDKNIFNFSGKTLKSRKRKVYTSSKEILSSIKNNNSVVATLNYNKNLNRFEILEIVSYEPILQYPYLPALLHRIKNLNLHVSMHWVAVIAYLISMIFSIKFLRNGNIDNDIISSSAIKVGLVFTLLGTFTGMIWAKFDWGTYWNWDPRQTTILIITLIYFAYFGLRSSIENYDKKAKLSSVYSIIAFLTVPFLIFVIPRLLPSLHPGGSDDGTTGPVVSTQADMVDSSLAFTFYLSIFGFLMLYFWILSITTRQKKLSKKLRVL